jgi:hypothetical protein
MTIIYRVALGLAGALILYGAAHFIGGRLMRHEEDDIDEDARIW